MNAIVPSKGEVEIDPKKSAQRFTGLSNQGATCYMNSLLQSLYMTPELRHQIYNWKYDQRKHGDKKTCIPFQLQVLFGKLQISKRPSVETKSLTKSFGWDIKESFQQHDVQEFCRVLFDAIEESVKGTDSENMISSLYEGIMTDYVKCNSCENESKRSDRFLDLSLTVRNDFEQIKNDSIEKALLNYIKPEVLSGGNQYMCDICAHKVDAAKGLKIDKFPYILVAQIKRFDLNYNTMQRIKLNDRVTFPQILNANCFLGEPKDTLHLVAENLEEERTISVPDLKFAAPEGLELKTLTTTAYESLIDDRDKSPLAVDRMVKERIIYEQTEKRKKRQQEMIETYKVDGDYVYELFSIMIHSGSAMGGHYYAYIKCFEDSKWYNFNDSTVKEIEEKEITKVFGGESTSSWGSSYSANAYLLMYRKIGPDNIIRVDDSEIPGYIAGEILDQVEEEKKEASAREEKSQSIHFRVAYNKKEVTFTTRKDRTLGEFKLDVIGSFAMTERPEDVRLRAYSSVYEVFQETYEEDRLISALQCWDYKVFGIEVKAPEAQWAPYDPNLITVKVHLWEGATEANTLPEPHNCFVNKSSTVSRMIEGISARFGIPVEEILLFKKAYMGMNYTCERINEPRQSEYSLINAKVYEGSLLYLERKAEGKPRWVEFIEQEARRYTIRFNNPTDPLNGFSNPEYKYSIVIDQQASLNDLKQLIAKKLDLPVDSFLMKRGGSQSQEVKDLSIKLIQANLMNNSIIFIEKGVPTSANQYRILFSIATSPRATESKANCYSFLDLFDMPVDATITISEVKSIVCQRINEMYPTMSLDSRRIRLRERNTDRLSKAMRSQDTLKNYAIYERKMVSVQILDKDDEDVPPTHMIIVAKRFNPSTWEIHEPHEFLVKRTCTVQEIGEVFAGHYQIEVFFM